VHSSLLPRHSTEKDPFVPYVSVVVSTLPASRPPYRLPA